MCIYAFQLNICAKLHKDILMIHQFPVHDLRIIAEYLVKETCWKKRLRLLNSTEVILWNNLFTRMTSTSYD